MASIINFSEQLFLYQISSQSRYLCMDTAEEMFVIIIVQVNWKRTKKKKRLFEYDSYAANMKYFHLFIL